MKAPVLAAAVALAAVAALAASGDRKAPTGPSGKTVSCSKCREKGDVVDPATLDPNSPARKAYEIAWKHPELLDKIHCFCGCEDSPNFDHKSLLSCYTSLHAAGCEICQGEAEMAGRMKREGGSTDEEIAKVVESLYGPAKH